MNTHRDIIKAVGGVHAIAAKLNMKAGTVQVWKHRQHIPRHMWPDLIEKFPKITMKALKAGEGVVETKSEAT